FSSCSHSTLRVGRHLFLTLNGTELTLEVAPSSSTTQVAIEPPRGVQLSRWQNRLSRLFLKQERRLSQASSSNTNASRAHVSRKPLPPHLNVPGLMVSRPTFSDTQQASGWRKVVRR